MYTTALFWHTSIAYFHVCRLRHAMTTWCDQASLLHVVAAHYRVPISDEMVFGGWLAVGTGVARF
jgi:ABC-type tungstate transport system permease subunit